MVEREVRSKKDVLEFIEERIKAKGIGRTQIEKEARISQGMISRWMNEYKCTPSLSSVISILKVLDAKIILRTNEPEDNSGVKEEKNFALDEDALLIALLVKILKSEIASSDKEKLYKILEAFV